MYLLLQSVQYSGFISCHRFSMRPDFVQYQVLQADLENPVPGAGAVSGGGEPGAEIRSIVLDSAILPVLGFAGGNQRMPTVRTDQLSGKQ